MLGLFYIKNSYQGIELYLYKFVLTDQRLQHGMGLALLFSYFSCFAFRIFILFPMMINALFILLLTLLSKVDYNFTKRVVLLYFLFFLCKICKLTLVGLSKNLTLVYSLN